PTDAVLVERGPAVLHPEAHRELTSGDAELGHHLPAYVVPDLSGHGVDVRIRGLRGLDFARALGDGTARAVHADPLEEAQLVRATGDVDHVSGSTLGLPDGPDPRMDGEPEQEVLYIVGEPPGARGGGARGRALAHI